MYQNAFTYNKLGYGCALAWFMILVVGIFDTDLVQDPEQVGIL